MLRSLAVIIPARNEEESIASAVASALAAGADEVIVSDGGSADGTVAAAERAGAKVIAGGLIRGEQLNRAAAQAVSDALLFLHADSRLPANAATLVLHALNDGHVFGGFRIAFSEKRFRLRVAAALINLRTRFTRCPWGDQGQFISRERFIACGGFLPVPIMEDYAMALGMKRLGRIALLKAVIETSARRFLRKGVLRTAAVNWYVIALYRTGKPPEELAKIYRR